GPPQNQKVDAPVTSSASPTATTVEQVGLPAGDGAAIKSVMALLYLLGVAALFSVTFFLLEFHWFWAASVALLAPCWLTYGVVALVRERHFADNAVARWIRNKATADAIVTELSTIDG